MDTDVYLTHQERIYRDLKQCLDSSQVDPGEKLPSLRELAKRYNTSIGSVRQALLLLKNEDLITCSHGRGYFAAPEAPRGCKRVLLLESGINDHLYSLFVQKFQQIIGATNNYILQIESPEDCRCPETACPELLLKKIHLNLANGLDVIFFDGEKVWGITPEEFSRLKEQVPLFYFNSPYPAFLDAGVPGVGVDRFVGGYKAIRHLIDVGCRQILCYMTEDSELMSGCEDAVKDSPENVQLYFFSPLENLGDSNYYAMLKEHSIDGFFACCDSHVMLNLPLFQQCGYRLPEDLAIMGFYDTPWCEFMNIQLSSVNVYPEQMIQCVWDMYTGRKAKSQEKMQPQLIQRDSTLKFKPRSGKK